MFDFKAALEDEKNGVKEYNDAAVEMAKKYPHKLYSLQFRMLAKQEAHHHDILEKMMKEIEKEESEVK